MQSTPPRRGDDVYTPLDPLGNDDLPMSPRPDDNGVGPGGDEGQELRGGQADDGPETASEADTGPPSADL